MPLNDVSKAKHIEAGSISKALPVNVSFAPIYFRARLAPSGANYPVRPLLLNRPSHSRRTAASLPQ